MKNKHTDCDWKVNTSKIDAFRSIGMSIEPVDGSGAIAMVLGGVSEECKANAKIIAAAPRMLKALKEIREYENRCRKKGDPNFSEHWFSVINDAIEYAERP